MKAEDDLVCDFNSPSSNGSTELSNLPTSLAWRHSRFRGSLWRHTGKGERWILN